LREDSKSIQATGFSHKPFSRLFLLRVFRVAQSGSMTKGELRAHLKQTLAGLSPEAWRQGSEGVCARLLEVLRRTNTGTAMFFFPRPGEIDIGPAAKAAMATGVRVCLPRTGWAEGTLTPKLVDEWGEKLSVSRHGVQEPAESAPSVNVTDLDLIVVPGLGFDESGGRLGRGGGFFDRFLARPEVRAWKVGVGLDEQVVERLPRDPWDIPVDAVVTPTRTLVFRPW
jgi:5-formyltetrahydrofolate cyclo-ligase